MTTENPFTQDELRELLTALIERRDRIAKLHANRRNSDWKNRDAELRSLKEKILAMVKS